MSPFHTVPAIACFFVSLVVSTNAIAMATTPGEFSVTPTGSASYTIPIQAPPGTAGMHPDLSLNYSSQSGNGIWGQGWSLNGLSVIHRCPKTMAQDDVVDGINYDSEDRFCMDGQRLVAKNGLYGANGTEYRTEIESFSRIVSYGQSGSGPTWFKVWTKSGQIMEYGNTVDSRVEALNRVEVRVWANNKVMDTVGNYMTVKYLIKKEKGQYCPSRIDYTSNDAAGLAAQRSIRFENTYREDVTNSYVAGSKVVNDMLITNIKTYVNESNIKDYRLSYSSDNDIQRNQIQSMTECDGAGNCLPATQFGYNKTGRALSESVEWGRYVGTPGNHEVMFNSSMVDMDGDGLPDFLYRLQDSTLFRVAINTGEGFDDPVDWGSYPERMGDNNDILSHYLSDMNGDGLVDLLYRVDGTKILKVLINTGQAFEEAVVWGIYPDRMGDNFQLYMHSMSDMNGDGLVDLAYRIDGTRILKVMINTGASFDTPVVWGEYTGDHPGGGSVKKLNYSMTDLNGDGLADFLFRENSSYTLKVMINTGTSFEAPVEWLTYPDNTATDTVLFSSSLADMNGDGLVDFVQRAPNTQTLKVMLNTGAFFEDPVVWGEYTGEQPGSDTQLNYLLSDMNGDGTADFLFRENYSKTYKVLINNGASFGTPVEWGTYNGTMSYSVGFINYAVVDMNGDGLADILYRNKFIDVSSRVLFSLTSTPVAPFSLDTVTDGLGAQTKINYLPLTDSRVYTKGNDAVFPDIDIQSARSVVSDYSSSDGVGGMHRMFYAYSREKVNVHGRGSLGFYKVSTLDSRRSIQSNTTYLQAFPFMGVATLSETIHLPTTLLKRSESIPSVTEQGTGNGKNYFVHIDSANEQTYELDGTPVTSVNTTTTHDAYGNPTRIVVDNNDGYVKTTVNIYTNDTTNWFLGRLSRAETTSATPLGDAATRTSAFSYNAENGLLDQEIIEPDKSEFRLVTDHDYDVLGNKTSVTISGQGIVSRTTSTTYDDDYHTFPASVTNAAGHTETREYESGFGKRTKLIGPNLLATTWEYDGFGRLTKEIRADGTETTKEYCGPNECFYVDPYNVITRTSGQPFTRMAYDILGREILNLTIGFDGSTRIAKNTFYNQLGQVKQVSNKYYSGVDAPLWYRYTYDVLGRVLIEENPDGSRTDMTYDGLTTTTVNDQNQSMIKIKDSQGQLVSSVDSQFAVTAYEYDPFGNLLNVIDPVGNVSLMSYDLRGRKVAMNDPDMGSWVYTYNVLGELIQQIDAKGQVISMEYDVLGRLVKRTEPEGISTWQYDTANKGVGKLATATSLNGYQKSHSYDDLGRPDWINTKISGTSYVVQTTFDLFGRVSTHSYPTGLTTRNVYTSLGYLQEVRNAANDELYWKRDAMNAHGQTTQYTLGNGLTTVNTYDQATNRVSGITTGFGTSSTVQNLGYDYDTLGNLTSRSDLNQNLSETFAYDSLNRLVETNFLGIGSKTYQYDSLGNIVSKSDVGTYTYGQNGAGPHAVTQTFGIRNNTYSYDANGNQVSGAGRVLTYTSFNKPLTVVKDTTVVEYGYDTERNRIIKTKGADRTIYIGKMYEKVLKSGVLEHKQYISAGKMTFAVLNTKGTTTETRYMHKDHLGSTDVITDELGNVVERMSFDSHGQRRYSDWGSSPIGISLVGYVTSRGFTGHEMDDEIGLINMNARMYDPVLGRFLSPDTYVQFPENAQSYNRYTYVNNNPLSFTDPSGHFLKKLFKGIKKLFRAIKKYIKPIVAAVAAYYTFGAVFSTLGKTLAAQTFLATGSYSISNVVAYAVAGAAGGAVAGAIVSGDLKGTLYGGVSGALFGGITGYFGDGSSISKVFAESTAGGINAEFRGGKFSDGFKAAFTQSALTYATYSARKYEIKHSRRAGVVGDGSAVMGLKGRIAGIRPPEEEYKKIFGYELDTRDPRYAANLAEMLTRPCSNCPLGGRQGSAIPTILGVPYSTNGFVNRVTETYGGMHDFLNHPFFYNQNGSSHSFLRLGSNGFIPGETVNAVNVAVATPFAASVLVPSYIRGEIK